MNVWIRKARKQSTCAFDGCPYPQKAIRNQEFHVVCQWIMPTRNGQKWRKQKVLHISCWIKQAMAAINAKPVCETRGRHRMPMTDAVRAERLKLMQRRASLVQRLNNAVDAGKFKLAERLAGKVGQCSIDIEPFGGAPEKWNKKE